MDIFEFLYFFILALLALFLVAVFLKKILFWLYLWQLKEYHIGRFLAHFSTTKGKELLLNKVNLLKIFFLFIIIIYYYSVPHDFDAPFTDYTAFWLKLFILSLLGLFFIYTAEGLKSLKDFFQKTIKKPIFTKKIILLFSIIVIAATIFFYFTLQREVLLTILIFDLLIPFIVSAVVLLFQPLTVLARNRIIRKAKNKREQFKNLLVIGITGSYGKTSTKEFLAAILSEKFNVLKTKEHQNSEAGISQCILNDLKPEHEIFVCEMGAYNLKGIKLLCDIVKPKIGILTGINEQHMATFGSLENIIKTKYELIENLPENGAAFFNAKNKYCLELHQKTKIKKYLYGEETIFFGEENLLGAMAVARELGMTEEEISLARRKIENKAPGIKTKKGINGLTIIDATYSANPDGVIGHLDYLKSFPNKKIIVMPCLIELGKATIKVHKKIGRKIGEVCAPVKEPNGSNGTPSGLAIITTKDRFKELKEGFIEGGGKEGNILFIEDPEEIFEKLKTFCKEGDAVLLESRVPEPLIKQLNI